MTFARRRIEATITLSKGTFGDAKGDTVKLSGLRMSASMSTLGQASMGQMQLRVFGLPLEMMNRLTSVGPIAAKMRLQNRLVVAAGNLGERPTTIFDGMIESAWAEFAAAPDVVLNVSGLSGLKDALQPTPPLSFQGTADVADIMGGLATTMGYYFENNGVSVQLSNPYFPGTPLEQVRSCARAADISYTIDNGTLAIWPRKGFRRGEPPVISSATGLVGYPAFTASGVSLVTIFAPNVKQGGRIRLESQLTPANGEWNVLAVTYNLECETPGGQWFTHIECGRLEST